MKNGPKAPSERYSGHESFVCRYGWLRKLYDAVSSDPKVFKLDDEAMVALGVGRNMVKSVQFWGEAFGIVSGTATAGYLPTTFGRRLLDLEHGADPYLEDTASLWLLHWVISTGANLGAWNAIYEELRDTQFTRDRLVNLVAQRAKRTKGNLARTTVEQHVGMLLATYCADVNTDTMVLEESLGSPLQELGLIRQQKSIASEIIYQFDSGPKAGLSLHVFLFALQDYWNREAPESRSISLRDVTYGAKSPGTIFRLDEDSVVDYLKELGRLTRDQFQFIETADTRNIIRREPKPSGTSRTHHQ